MTDASQAGDTTFTRNALSLDYHCAKCGTRITHWTAEIVGDAQKLRLTAHCHGETETRLVYLGMGGVMFRTEGD